MKRRVYVCVSVGMVHKTPGMTTIPLTIRDPVHPRPVSNGADIGYLCPRNETEVRTTRSCVFMAKVLKSGVTWMSYIRTRITGPASDHVSCGRLPMKRNEKCHAAPGHNNMDAGREGNAENCRPHVPRCWGPVTKGLVDKYLGPHCRPLRVGWVSVISM
jgi:hypothetical protein